MVVSCLIHLDTSLIWKLAGLGGRWVHREVGVMKERKGGTDAFSCRPCSLLKDFLLPWFSFPLLPISSPTLWSFLIILKDRMVRKNGIADPCFGGKVTTKEEVCPPLPELLDCEDRLHSSQAPARNQDRSTTSATTTSSASSLFFLFHFLFFLSFLRVSLCSLGRSGTHAVD